MNKAPMSAKVSAPRLSRIIERPRLFQRLDRGLRDGLVWICAPPGSGKTSLVSSYLKRRHLRPLWYQIDATDNDPATFFHYLASAVRAANPRSRRRLPMLRSEYLSTLPIFTRRFFEVVAATLKAPCLFVLDNYQDLHDDSFMHELLQEALNTLGGTGVVVCSRSEPPATFARLNIQGRITVIDSAELVMTLSEARDLARLRALKLPAATIERRLSESSGWAAGLALLMEEPESLVDATLKPGCNAQVLFDYFAHEVFARMDPDTRQVLLATCFLPDVTLDRAQRLTQTTRADEVLSGLARRNYFTSVHAAGGAYRFHSLFRDFLQTYARNTFTQQQLDAILSASAVLLEEAGEVEAAARLLAEIKDWPAFANLCQRSAAQLLAQGRAPTLMSWVMMLPEELRERSPWLVYWLAMTHQSFVTARSLFAKAFALFCDQGNASGQFLAWAGIARSYLLLWDEFKSSDHWISVFEDLRCRHPEPLSPAIERRVVSGILALLVFRQPYHKDIAHWAARLSILIGSADQPEEQVQIASPLLTYYLWTGDLGNAGLLIDSLQRAIRARGAAAPERMVFMLLEAAYLWHMGEAERCLKVVDEALALADSRGFHGLDARIRAQALYANLGLGELDRCRQILAAAGPHLDPGKRLDSSHYHYQAACFHRLDGNLVLAESHCRKAMALAIESGAVFPRGLAHVNLALILIDRGAVVAAAAHLHAVFEIGRAINSPLLLYMQFVVSTWLAMVSNEKENARQRLREAFMLGARHHYVSPWEGWSRPMLARLCQLALESNIEADYAMLLIHRCTLLPLDSSCNSDVWPWKVKIYTFGRFQIHIDGKLQTSGRKGQARPLELLKLLVARGARGVAEQELSAVLWPEANGDDAHRAFATTLHRLRRLLKYDKAVHLENGRVSLDSRWVWLDRWVFEHLLQDSASEDNRRVYCEAFGRVLSWYHGDFLAGDDAQWAILAREQLRSKFRRKFCVLVKILEHSGRWADAVEWYRRGVEVDPLAEEMHAGLIRAHGELKQDAEATAAYASCEKLLLAAFGQPPGPEVRRAYAEAAESAVSARPPLQTVRK